PQVEAQLPAARPAPPRFRTIQNNSDPAQGPHPIRPSKVRRSDIYLAPGGVHGTETKTSYRRDGSCDGVDHPSGHDVGGGSAELVTPSSTSAFVLGRSTSFLPPTLDARRDRQAAVRSHPERRQAGRTSGPVVEQVRAGDQSQDRESPRTYYSRAVPAARRRGHRMTAKMKRRAFIALLGGAAVSWPVAARAQELGRMRHVVFLHALAENDAEVQARITVFR